MSTAVLHGFVVKPNHRAIHEGTREDKRARETAVCMARAFIKNLSPYSRVHAEYEGTVKTREGVHPVIVRYFVEILKIEQGMRERHEHGAHR